MTELISLSDLRKEQLASPDPSRHVFRLTRKQESEIVLSARQSLSSTNDFEIVHLSTIFGCRVELVD